VGDHVWVVVAGRAHTRAVRVAASLGNDVPVLSGLALGDHVILKPSVALTEGATVTKKGE